VLLKGRPIWAAFLLNLGGMSANEFKVEVLAKEVVVRHTKQGHIYKFPIGGHATVSLRGASVAPNPKAKRGARGYLLEAHKAARAAFE